jgi:hypothetical protein
VIAKVTRGTDGSGLVRYLFGPGKADEHTDQRVVAAGEGIEVAKGVPLSAEELADLSGQVDASKLLYGVDVADGHIWHLSLTNPAGDRELSDEEWGSVVKETMDRLGFSSASGKAPCAWVAVRHGRSAAGNDHVHVAVSLVREDGTKASIWRDRVRLSELCADFERRLGLTVVDGRQRGGLPAPSRPEIEASYRRGRPEVERTALARVVRAAAVLSRDEAEFVRRLRAGAVLARPRYAQGGRSEVVGYSVALRPIRDGAQPIWFGGGRLGADLALPALRQQWDRSGEAARSALGQWGSGPHHRLDGRESVVRGADGWRHAAERVALSVDALGTVPAGEALRWASVARETSGVFGAWAGRIEKAAPGALCRAADTLAWSAQTRRGGPRPAERDNAVVDFRGVAGVAAQAAIGADSAAGWLLLIRQMTRTVEVVRRAHEERGEALQAARLAALLGGELAELHRDFERSAAAAMAPGAGYDRAARDRPGEYRTDRDRPGPRRGGEPGSDGGFER